MPKETGYNPNFHPEDLVKRMSEGQTDVEIFADWDISKATFYRWRQEFPELEAAHARALPKWESAWLKKGINFMENGNREAYKYWAQIMGIKGGAEYRPDKGNVTNVHVNQMNVLSNKSEAELTQILQNKMQRLNIQQPDAQDAEFRDLDEGNS